MNISIFSFETYAHFRVQIFGFGCGLQWPLLPPWACETPAGSPPMFQKTVQHFCQGWDPEPRTSFCKRWEQGNCNFGSACHFAHGERELRGRALVVAASVLSPGGGANVAVNVPTPPPAVPPQAQGYGYSESSGSDWGCEGCGGCGCGGYGCGGCGSCSGCAGGCPAGCCGSGYSKGCNSCGCGKGAGCGPCGSCGGAGCGPCNGAGCGPCGPCGCGKGGPRGCGHSACGSSCAPHSGPCHAGPCGPCGPGGPHGSCAGAGACGCGGCGPSCGPGCGFGCGACGFQGEHMEAAGYLLSCRVQSFGPFLRPRKLNLWWDMVPGRHGRAVRVFLIMMKRSQSGNFFFPKEKVPVMFDDVRPSPTDPLQVMEIGTGADFRASGAMIGTAPGVSFCRSCDVLLPSHAELLQHPSHYSTKITSASTASGMRGCQILPKV